MNSALVKKYHLNLVCVALCICFAALAHFSLDAYNENLRLQKQSKDIQAGIRFVRSIKADQGKKKRILARLRAFLDQASALGLNEDRWARYNVGIEDNVSFSELRRILDQCTNTGKYYFKPSLFIAGPGQAKARKKGAAGKDTNAASPNAEGSDIFLTIKGAFVAKNR